MTNYANSAADTLMGVNFPATLLRQNVALVCSGAIDLGVIFDAGKNRLAIAGVPLAIVEWGCRHGSARLPLRPLMW